MLVGRDSELQRCRTALVRALDGQAATFEILGEPGIGKTALLAAVAAADEQFLRLHATGVPAESVIAYAALEALLRPVTGWVNALPAPAQSAIRAALRLDDTVMPDPLPLVGSVLTLLAAASAERPLLLTIDDAQWLDVPSRVAFQAIGRRLGGERIVMITASRDSATLGRPDEHAINLTALTQPDAEALLRARRPDLVASVIEELHRQTAGNPLALLELADYLTPEQVQGLATVADLDYVPKRIQTVHLARIAALSAPARGLLAIVACAGQGELPIVVAAAHELGLGEGAIEALDELTAGGLVDVNGSTVLLRHPLLRPTIVTSVGPSGTRRANLSLAAALADIDPDRALWHRAATPTGLDEDLAVELAEFAERLAARGQPDSARQALEAAATFTSSALQRAERLVRAAEVSLRGTNGAATIALLDQLRPLTFLPASHRRRLDMVQAWTAVRAGHRSRAASTLVEVAREMPASERPGILTQAVAAALSDGDVDTAHDGVILLEVGRPLLPDGELRRFVDLARSAVDYLSARTRPAFPDPLRQTIERWPGTNHVPTLSVMRDTALESGNLTTARSISVALTEIVRASGDVSALAQATLALAFCDHALVNWNSAASRAFEVTQLVQESTATVTVVQALLLLADIDGSRGRAEACRATCARVRMLAEDLSDPSFAVLADRREAMPDIAGADPATALHSLNAADRRFRQAGLTHPYVSAVPDLVEVLVRLDRRDQAAAIAPRFLELVGDTSPHPPRARALRIHGLIAGEGYDDFFNESITLDIETGQSFHAARTMLCQGERRRRDRRRMAARECLAQALDIFTRADAAPWVRRTESELSATGAAMSTSSRSSTFVPTLTNRELQVSTLVAEGLRNHEIAAALYMSTKTVEAHLSRAYRKAGVSNRTQLASFITRT